MKGFLDRLFDSDLFLRSILPAVATLVVAWAVGRVLGAIVRRIIRRVPHADVSFERLFGGVASWTVYLIGLIAALNYLGVNTTGLLAALGAAGLAVGLALKDTLGNIAAGLLLLFQRPLRTGEFIQSGSTSGTVELLGLFSTRLRAPDGVSVTIPNSLLWNGVISNYSVNPTRRLDVPVSISYSDSIDTGVRALLAVAAAEKRFAADPAPVALVSSLDDSGVTLILRGWVQRQDYWPAKFDLTREVKLAVEKAGLTIPFPQRDVHLVGGPAGQ